MALRTSSRRATAALRLLPRSRPLSTRTESDAFGPIEVSTEVLWGAQTQRSLQNFPIGGPAARMPDPVIKAFGVLKKCASQYNMGAGLMDEKVGGAIVAAADEVVASTRTRTGVVRAAGSTMSPRRTATRTACPLLPASHPWPPAGHRRHARRALPARRLPDGQRHAGACSLYVRGQGESCAAAATPHAQPANQATPHASPLTPRPLPRQTNMNVHEIPNPNPNPNPSPIQTNMNVNEVANPDPNPNPNSNPNQTNMNVNEVISNRAIQILGGEVRYLVITLTKCVT
eukprot:scaffold20850_cov49-Phaeocystis_antarctica.AAC.2